MDLPLLIPWFPQGSATTTQSSQKVEEPKSLTSLDCKIIEKTVLYSKIKKKRLKLQAIQQILYRNHHEYQTMVKHYEKLDREIFEEKEGIKKVTMHTKKTKEVMDNIDNLSDEMAAKLLARLLARQEECRLAKVNQSLQTKTS